MKFLNKMKNSKAFTLIELSIVILVIGLIIAGISVGSALTDQAKIRGIIGEFQEYKLSYDSFRARYNAIPGDFNNAELYWPNGATGCVAAGGSCNGNGNGIIEHNIGEAVLAMRQMYMAGILKQSISQPGTGGITTTIARLGITYPRSNSINGVGYVMNAYVNDTAYPKTIAGLWGAVVNISAFAGFDEPLFGNVLYLGKSRNGDNVDDGSGVLAGSSNLNPQQVISIETKIDDGRFSASFPGYMLGGSTGKIRTVNSPDIVLANPSTYCVDGSGVAGVGHIGYAINNRRETCYVGFYLD